MITNEFITECLDVLELSYTELPSGAIAVSFRNDEIFAHDIVTLITVTSKEDGAAIEFLSYAFDYHPSGDLLEMVNRHNCRTYMPCAIIDADGDVVFKRICLITQEVNPVYILEGVLRPNLYFVIDSFATFEMDDDQLRSHRESMESE